MTIRVVIADPSVAERDRLMKILEADGDIRVVAHTGRSTEAIALARAERPDVLIIDLELGGAAAGDLVGQVMAYTPTPILVLSAADSGPASAAAVEALVAGAVDALPKPGVADESGAVGRQLRDRVRLVQGVMVVRHPRGRLGSLRKPPIDDPARPPATTIVAIGASTGGPAALAAVLSRLADLPAAVLVVQHLHPDFVDGFVTWMARVSALPVELATGGTAIRPGTVYVAPGGTHLTVGRTDRLALDPQPETLHRPSVDMLFSSVAARPRGSNVGVLLTGIGDDGAVGLCEIRKAGGLTIAQDEASCAVYGMPEAARRLDAVDRQLPLDLIATAIVHATTGRS